MFERMNARVLPLANRAAELTPTATACCNACRTCTTTNILTLLAGFGVGAAVGLRRMAGRLARSS